MIHRLIRVAAVALLATACHRPAEIVGSSALEPAIFPDYRGVTIPCNIAPLNFDVVDTLVAADGWMLRVAYGADGEERVDLPIKQGAVDFRPARWRRMLARSRGGALHCTLCHRRPAGEGGGWVAHPAFRIEVSADSIDPYLLYRRIPPEYGLWNPMGLYQRNLETFDEEVIYENGATGNCINCHSLCNRNPEQMLFHIRTYGGATYVLDHDRRLRLNTKSDSLMSNFVYPYWHPSGRYAAFSVNQTFLICHTADPNRVEVYDEASDVVVYDLRQNRVLTTPLLRRPDRMETFPSFSADGRSLYFCSSVQPDSMPQKYRDVRYDLCRIGFDPETGRFGEVVEILIPAAAQGRSVSYPRESPDGRQIVVTLSDYGNFSIWHKEADLYRFGLADGSLEPLDGANSGDAESYHAWSGNSRWLVVSSRRDDGLYTRPYLVHIGADGRAGKAFLLPQRRPARYYRSLMYSFNIPEFARERVDLSPGDIHRWMEKEMTRVR